MFRRSDSGKTSAEIVLCSSRLNDVLNQIIGGTVH